MMEPSLSLQAMIYQRLIATTAVTSLVPAAAIYDRNKLPENDNEIIIGTGNVLFGDSYGSFHERVFLDAHVWVREEGLSTCKTVAFAIKQAVSTRPWIVSGNTLHGLTVSARYLRDGDYSHAVVSFDAVMQVAA